MRTELRSGGLSTIGTGSRLFHRYGIGGTGIDRVIADAGVAKATFYRLFPSKEDLVIAWLQDPALAGSTMSSGTPNTNRSPWNAPWLRFSTAPPSG